MKRCVQCSEMLPGDANFCPVCGGKAEAVSAAPTATANVAVAPTMPDMNALGGRSAPAPTKSVPPPAPTTASGVVGTDSAPAPGGGKNAAFRETLWFKKGEVDEFLAKARSASSAGPGPGGPGSPEAPAEDIRPLEDRYQDDGSLSSADRAKFSLRTGATVYQQQSPLKAKPVAVPGQRMSDQELIAEFGAVKGKGRWIALGVGALLLILIASLFSGKKSAPEQQPAEAPAPAAH